MLSKSDVKIKRSWLHDELKKQFNKNGVNIALGISFKEDRDFAVRIQGGNTEIAQQVIKKIQELVPESNPDVVLLGKLELQ